MSDVAVADFREQSLPIVAATRATHARHGLSADVLRGAVAYDTLRSEWQRLAKRHRGTTIFQSPEMLSAWSRHFADSQNDLVTVVVRRGGRAVLIWPLFIDRTPLVRIARSAGAPIGQYDEMLLDPDCDGAHAFAAATEALTRTARPHLILVERVRADGELRNALSDVAPLACAEGAPYSDLSRGMPHFMASLKTRVTRQQRKRVRRFEQEGKVEFAVAASAEQAEAWLAEAIAIKREWLRATGRVSRAFVRSETAQCLAELARNLAGSEDSARMVVSRLSLDGRTAAIEMGFCQGGTYHLYLGAFAPEFAKFGPGNILTEKLLGWCVANGIERYDMMAPRTRNKSEWQSGEVAVMDFALPTTIRGRLYLACILRRLVPWTRRLFYALPDSVRSRLAGVALGSADSRA